jgi:hypothetical protein
MKIINSHGDKEHRSVGMQERRIDAEEKDNHVLECRFSCI